MRRVLLVLLTIAILPSPGAAQECIDYGDYLHRVGAVSTPGQAYDVAVAGNYAYVADYNSGLQVIDVSVPASSALVGSADTPGAAYDVAVAVDYAYVADRDFGLRVIDISAPESPALVGGVDTPGEAAGVAVTGDYAYVGDGVGLQVAPLQCDAAAVPILLGYFDAILQGTSVRLEGSLAIESDVGTLRVRARRGAGEWDVPLVVEYGTRFHAVDSSDHLLDGGAITYALYAAETGGDWSLLAERTVNVGAPIGHVQLLGATPNPFNPSTTIRFDLPRPSNVELTIYDMAGRRVRTLVQETRPAGRHQETWHGVDDGQRPVSSGVYLCKLTAGSYVETRRMTLLK